MMRSIDPALVLDVKQKRPERIVRFAITKPFRLRMYDKKQSVRHIHSNYEPLILRIPRDAAVVSGVSEG